MFPPFRLTCTPKWAVLQRKRLRSQWAWLVFGICRALWAMARTWKGSRIAGVILGFPYLNNALGSCGTTAPDQYHLRYVPTTTITTRFSRETHFPPHNPVNNWKPMEAPLLPQCACLLCLANRLLSTGEAINLFRCAPMALGQTYP